VIPRLGAALRTASAAAFGSQSTKPSRPCPLTPSRSPASSSCPAPRAWGCVAFEQVVGGGLNEGGDPPPDRLARPARPRRGRHPITLAQNSPNNRTTHPQETATTKSSRSSPCSTGRKRQGPFSLLPRMTPGLP
jgi:hypothetical protein